MGKYEPLASYLNSITENSWEASFGEIERNLSFPLPASAHRHRAWWANQQTPGHSQAEGWMAAGWETRFVDQQQRRVRFEKAKDRGTRENTTNEHLWRQAERLTGIPDRDALQQAAVMALIRLEASRRLADLGGSMPNAVAAPRDRLRS